MKQKLVIAGILRHALMQALDRLLDDDGTPDEDALRKCDTFGILIFITRQLKNAR